MDRSSDNLWTRRSNNNKLSLSTTDREHGKGDSSFSSRAFSGSKRFGGDGSSQGRGNPFNANGPLSATGVASPSTGSSTAFGLGSGAFASFGSASKTPKTPGSAFDFGRTRESATTPGEKKDKKENEGGERGGNVAEQKNRMGEGAVTSTASTNLSGGGSSELSTPWPLKYTWVIWYRPPTSKNSDYEKSIKAVCKMGTAQEFWRVYTHLKRPSSLPAVSDYHFFKESIRPVWEDDENKRGGKWIMRLKKGVSDHYWEDLLLALIGDQFAEAGEEVCGMVLSVRSGEDVFSIWTKNDGGRNIKIRETIKRVLALPPDTQIVWKSHDDSIAQRSAIDQARQDKGNQHERRRVTLSSQDTLVQGEKS